MNEPEATDTIAQANKIINDLLDHLLAHRLSFHSSQRVMAGDLSPLLNCEEDALRWLAARHKEGLPIRQSNHDLLQGLGNDV